MTVRGVVEVEDGHRAEDGEPRGGEGDQDHGVLAV
jgi:hypothetical protein